MRKVHIDFESRSTVDIWQSGVWVYSTHRTTEILCLAYAVDDGPVKVISYEDLFTYPMSDPFAELRELANDKDTLFYAHNALFEQCIWQHKLSLKYGLPRLPINRWRCTMAKALSVGLPKSLAEAGAALGTKHQKDLRGRTVMLRLAKPRADGKFDESPALIKELEAYCVRDVETERDIDNTLPELSAHEQVVWFEDQLINMRGVAVDTVALDKALAILGKETVRLKGRVKTLSNGLLDGTSRRQATLDYLRREHKVILPDFTKATVEKAIANGNIPAAALEVLQIRQQLGLSSTAKYEALKDAICLDGRLRDTFMYYTAGTGRWGGKLVQLQNLPKGNFDSALGAEMLREYDYETLLFMYPNIMGLLSSSVRGMFVSSPGHDLIVADYSAIEARVLMWFCGEAEAVKMFANGADIYVDMAKRISKTAPRQLGKQAILACGYGMGHAKFLATCATYGISVTPELAQTAVYAYRNTYPKVVAMWGVQERAAIQAVTEGRKVIAGKVSWEVRGNFLWCTLPSGRKLAYHKPEIRARDTSVGDRTGLSYMAADSITKKYVRKDTYGGKIIENIIQATARDILADALLNSEKAGYPPVMHVHDEIVVEVPEGDGDVQEFTKIICAVPTWAKGCPINADAWRGKRYHK
jgi:DNA polymerase